MKTDHKILVGIIAGAHGIKGDVKLRSFTQEPDDIRRYKPITDESGERTFVLKIKGATNNYFIAAVDGVKDRNTAEALRNTKLYVERRALPKTKKREFYEADLAGLAAQDAQGKNCGQVIAVHNYGGGPFLEIATPEGFAFMLPFNVECVPSVAVGEGHIVIAPPDGWIDAQKPREKKKPQ